MANTCCDKWLLTDCLPSFPKKGRFYEKVICPECGQEWNVQFLEVEEDPGNYEYPVVGAEKT